MRTEQEIRKTVENLIDTENQFDRKHLYRLRLFFLPIEFYSDLKGK